MPNEIKRVTCLDCRYISFRIIPIDIPVYCQKCGSEALMWRSA